MNLQFYYNLLAMIFLLLGSQKHGSMNTNMTSMTYLTITVYIDFESGEEVVVWGVGVGVGVGGGGGGHYVWEMA